MTAGRRIGSALESLLLLSVGGAIVLSMGAIALLLPRRPSLSGILAFVALATLVLLGRPLSEGTARSLMTVPEAPDVPILEDPDYPMLELREVVKGIDDGDWEAEGLQFTALGQIRPLPGPDREFVLLRSYMICCAADALLTGFRVSGDGVAGVKDGEWVVVSGRLSTLPVPRPVARMRFGAASFPVISAEHEFIAFRVVRHSDTLPTVAELLGSDSLSRFREAMAAAGLMETLEGEGPFTVFAPIDVALKDARFDGHVPAVRDWASWHIVRGMSYSRDLYSVKTLRTIHGRDLVLEKDLGKVKVGGSRLVFKDVRGRNGIVHMICPALREVPGRRGPRGSGHPPQTESFAREGRMYHIVESDKSFEQASEDLAAAVERNGFGVLHIHDLGATLREKGVSFNEQCRVFEVCNPMQAAKVLASEMSLNMALPCRISVFTDDGGTRIGMIQPTWMLSALSDDPALADVAAEVEAATTRMIEEAK